MKIYYINLKYFEISAKKSRTLKKKNSKHKSYKEKLKMAKIPNLCHQALSRHQAIFYFK